MILLGLNEKSDYPWWERGRDGGRWRRAGLESESVREREKGGGVKAAMR